VWQAINRILALIEIAASRIAEWLRRREAEARADRDAAIRDDPGSAWLLKFGGDNKHAAGVDDNQAAADKPDSDA